MVDARSAGALPKTVKLAAALFVLYGVAVVINAVAVQGAAGWAVAWDFPRAILRLIGTGLIGWGLLRRARWAWWLGLILAVFWLVAGALVVLVFERGDVYWLPPSGFQIFLAGSLGCLGGGVALLLSPSARKVFPRPAA